MSVPFHSGHVYAAFDRTICILETWFVGRVPSIGTFENSTVRERLAQRIVEITLWPYVAICARRLEVGSTPVPPIDEPIDCGGITFQAKSGYAAISLRLFAYSLFEFCIHWLHVLGAILLGGLNRGREDNRPATLVFGIGQESQFFESNDARFATYCRRGPLAPLARARRLIVQCAAAAGSVTDLDFSYDRFPMHALIRSAKLGAQVRAELLWAHMAAPWTFLFAILRCPLAALLARDIAYASTVAALDNRGQIEAVMLTNAAYAVQPLWMRGPKTRHFPVHMAWYSQNTVPFVYAADGLVSDIPNYRHMRMDETWVWTPGYKTYLQKLGFLGAVHVVGPILWYLPVPPEPRDDDEIRVTIFDVTPVRDEVSARIGLINNYYSTKNMIRFIEESLSVCSELGRQTGRRVRVLLKHKRGYNPSHDQRYIDLIGHLAYHDGNLELVPHQTNMYSLVAGSGLSIVVPYSSPAYVASHVGARAVFFDPTMELLQTFEPAANVEFASGRAELLEIALGAVRHSVTCCDVPLSMGAAHVPRS